MCDQALFIAYIFIGLVGAVALSVVIIDMILAVW